MASFDENGLVIDRLADIKAQIGTRLESVFGSGIDLGEKDPMGALVGVMSERYSLIYELLQTVYSASSPDNSFGVYLDSLLAYNGVVREAATYSTVSLLFTRANGTNDGDVVVPAGTQVTSLAGTVIWETDALATILDGTDTITSQATANEVGALSAPGDTLKNMIVVPANVLSVNNPLAAVVGSEKETDSAVKIRRRTELGRVGTSTESGIRSALQLLEIIQTAVVVLNDTDFAVGVYPPHSINPYVSPIATAELSQKTTLTFDADLVTGNSIAITLDAVPIAASPVAFDTDNETTLTNIAAAIKAESAVGDSDSDGSDTITTLSADENNLTLAATVTGGASQAVVTFAELYQSDVDNLNLIAQTLWNSKAGGIQTQGDFRGDAIDDIGDTKTVYFSQVEPVAINVRLTLLVDASYDLATSEAAITQAVGDYGAANLIPGADVKAFKILSAASDVGSEGVETMTCEISDDGATYVSTIIDISSFEFATIESVDFVYL